MPLVPTVLQSAILSALTSAQTAPDTASAQTLLATQLSVAIDAYIRSAEVVIPSLAVTTTGGAGTTAPSTGEIV